MTFNTSKYFWDADAVINVCKYKTHSLMAFTGGVKNLYGLIPGLKKSDYHKLNPDHVSFGKVISNLYESVRQQVSFTIMDGILGMEGEGPSAGIPRNFGVMFACESAPALDYVASSMMGFKPEKLEYIMPALKVDGLKSVDIEVDDNWKDFTFPNVKIQGVKTLVKILAYSPKFLKNLFRKWFQVYPDFQDGCRLCRVCVDSCPVQAMKLEKGDLHPVIDHSKCIKCMCCHELCPFGVVFVKKSFLAKFVVK
jgi:ferredoxin